MPSTIATWIRPFTEPPEQACLEREVDAAKRAMRRSLSRMRRAANPLTLVRAHPVAAGALAGVAAAAVAAALVRGRDSEASPVGACPREPPAAARPGILRDVGRAVRGGLISVLTAKLLSAGNGASAGTPSAPAE